jgi:hypothetical protein
MQRILHGYIILAELGSGDQQTPEIATFLIWIKYTSNLVIRWRWIVVGGRALGRDPPREFDPADSSTRPPWACTHPFPSDDRLAPWDLQTTTDLYISHSILHPCVSAALSTPDP